MTESPLTIAGIGLVGGFGLGRQGVLKALQCGGGPNTSITVSTPSGPGLLPAYQAEVSSVRRFAPGEALRRMNRLGKIAVLGACLALEDAGSDIPLRRNDVGLIIASGYGASRSTFDFLDTMIDEGGRCPSPTLFSNSVHSSAASHVSIVLQLGGPCLTVSQFEMSPLSGLLSAREWLREGRVKAVLFGVVEEICPVLGYCYERFFGIPEHGSIEPFAWHRQSAVMGEGAAFLLLTAPGEAPRDCGQISGLAWTDARGDPLADGISLVLGADGHTCCAPHYRRWADSAAPRIAHSPLYGSLPGGQAFDLAIAAVAAREGLGPVRIRSVKCNAQGQCGIIEFCLGHDP